MAETENTSLEKTVSSDESVLVRSGYPRLAGYPDYYGYGSRFDDEELPLRKLWRLVRKRKLLIATVAIIVTTVVAIDQYRTKSIFSASAIVEIGRDTTNIARSGELLIPEDFSEMYVPTVGINTRMLVLRSRPLLEEVVVSQRLDQNPRFLDVTRRKSVWDALRAMTGREPEDQGEPSIPIPGSPDVESQGQAARSAEESKRLSPYVAAISANLKAEQIRDTRAVSISFTHTDPVVAAAVANGVSQVFIESNFRKKTDKFTNTSEWLERATRELKSRVQKAEQELADYTREHNIFSAEGSETLTTTKLSQLHDQATRAETDRILKHSLYQEVKAGRITQLPEAFADPRTAELEKELGKLSVTAAQLDLKYGPENPRVLEIRQHIASIQTQISESRKGLEEKLKADYERAVRDEQSLKAALARAKAEAVEQNQSAIQYNILRQEVETAKGLYTDFLQKTSQAKVQLAEQQNNLRLIEPAKVPGGPIGPMRTRTITMALFLSLVAGVGLAFFLDYLDNTVKSVEDVSRYAQLPALGVIPAIGTALPRRLLLKASAGKSAGRQGALSGKTAEQKGSSALMALDSRSSAAEAYRVLRTSVLLSAAGSPPKTILITSGQPAEGKTTTVVNTAISLAQLGSSVLIIDCDLRKPNTHKVFGVDPSRGLSNYMSRDVKIDSLIRKLPIPNLWLLPCGPIPPNPAELISSDKMKKMLRMLGERFDHILIDSPPLINVTDPVILSTMVDGVILVVHGGKSTREVLRRARQELSTVGAKIFGVVLNNVDLRRDGYDDYYYYRYYSESEGRRGEAARV